MLRLQTSSGHAVYVHEVTLLYCLVPLTLNLLVCLMDTPLDRLPAGVAYLLTGLLFGFCCCCADAD
jgi:hypothetical protein